MPKVKVNGCNDCGNKDLFIAEFSLSGECIVNKNGEEIEGIDSPSTNKYCDGGFTTKITNVYKCAKCGSRNIKVEVMTNE